MRDAVPSKGTVPAGDFGLHCSVALASVSPLVDTRTRLQSATYAAGIVWLLAGACLAPVTATANPVTSPPPPEVVFVPHAAAMYLTKHPKLPVVYLGCYYAAEHKNLATFPLHADGTVNTNGMQSFNWFTRDGTNELERYSLQRPIVLPEERILLLGSIPSAATYLSSDTNNAEIVAVSLDESGLPTQVRHGLRTTHGEKEIRAWQFDPGSRRLYLSYHSYFGWIPIGADGVPASNEFRLVPSVMTVWGWVYEPRWNRFFGRQTSSGLTIFALSGDGTASEFSQNICDYRLGAYYIEVSPSRGKLYFLNQNQQPTSLVIVNLTPEGRLTGLPREVPLADTYGFRIDEKTNRLYAWNVGPILRVYSLDAAGVPSGEPVLSDLKCGLIRDVVVDNASGKVYVACTSPPEK